MNIFISYNSSFEHYTLSFHRILILISELNLTQIEFAHRGNFLDVNK